MIAKTYIALSFILASLFLGRLTSAQDLSFDKDMAYAVKEIEVQCKGLLKAKKIAWKKITKPILKRSKKVRSEAEHVRLLFELLALLEDGHATVEPGPKADRNIDPFPEYKDHTGAGLFLFRSGKKIYIKDAMSSVQKSGILPGMEVQRVGKMKVEAWLKSRIAEHRQFMSFSTPQHVEFFALQRGLTAPKGSRWKLTLKDRKGKTKKKNLIFTKARQSPDGPAFFPKDIKSTKNINYGMTANGLGYIHFRRCKSSIVDELDEALAALDLGAKGFILDFRGNTGGSFNHEALLGRFIPKEKSIAFRKRYQSAGALVYGGNLVVIIDGTTVSAAETASGMFKEDGRAYMIGESPSAGMSSGKTRIKLPSGLAILRVSVSSNMQRFNGGKGIEGIGVIPHEQLPISPADIAEGQDTLIERAKMILGKFPTKEVPYQPADFGWRQK